MAIFSLSFTHSIALTCKVSEKNSEQILRPKDTRFWEQVGVRNLILGPIGII